MKIDFCHNVAEWCSTWLHNFGFPTFTILPTLRVPNETVVNERENSWIFRTFEMKLLKVVWNGLFGLSCGFYDESEFFCQRCANTMQFSFKQSNEFRSGNKVTTSVQTMMDTRVKFVCAHSEACIDDWRRRQSKYILCWLHSWYVELWYFNILHVAHRSSLNIVKCKM